MTGEKSSHVVFLVQNLPVPFDRRVWNEAKAIAGSGRSVTVICPSDSRHPAGVFDIEGICVRRYPAPPEARGVLGYLREYPWALVCMLASLLRVRARSRIDAIHYCNPPDLLFLVALPFRVLGGSRLIFDQHDIGPELIEAKQLPFAKVFRAISRILEQCSYSSAHNVIATNQSYKDIACGRGRRSPSRVHIVRSAPERSWPDDAIRSDAWRRGRQYLVGYVGVMGVQEGLEYLLDAAKYLVHDRGIDVQFALVGGGPDFERLQSYSLEIGVAEHVEFHGRLPDSELKSALVSADVCVNPDEVNEMNNRSTMNKIVEYMALGRPIVQFDVVEGRFSADAASLYAQANDAVDFAEKILYVLTNPDVAEKMSRFGMERFQADLCWENQVPSLFAAYDGV